MIIPKKCAAKKFITLELQDYRCEIICFHSSIFTIARNNQQKRIPLSTMRKLIFLLYKTA